MAKAGDRLMLRIADQAIVATPPAALQTVRALIRQRIPEGESLLVDALITTRRQEAQADDRAAQHTLA